MVALGGPTWGGKGEVGGWAALERGWARPEADLHGGRPAVGGLEGALAARHHAQERALEAGRACRVQSAAVWQGTSPPHAARERGG